MVSICVIAGRVEDAAICGEKTMMNRRRFYWSDMDEVWEHQLAGRRWDVFAVLSNVMFTSKYPPRLFIHSRAYLQIPSAFLHTR